MTSEKKNTMDYLALHNVTEHLQRIVNQLVKEKPARPYAFMAEQFQKLDRESLNPAGAPDVVPEVVFVLGGPGSGKGTQCAKIVEAFNYVHLSAGDLLRAAREAKDSTASLIETYIKEGKIVPVEITVNLIAKAMKQSGKTKFLVDGFPRNQDNMDGWNKVMGKSANVRLVLFFECSEETMQSRLLERGKTSGRSDDNIDSIKKRFKTFENETMPVVQAFEKQGLVRRIDASRSVSDVWDETRKLF